MEAPGLEKCLAVFGFLLLICFLSEACKRAEYTTGEAVYSGKCVKCHKLHGTGGEKGPDLTDILLKKDEDYVRAFTQDPRSMKPDGNMPPAKLSDRELALLIQYLKEQNAPSTTPGTSQ